MNLKDRRPLWVPFLVTIALAMACAPPLSASTEKGFACPVVASPVNSIPAAAAEVVGIFGYDRPAFIASAFAAVPVVGNPLLDKLGVKIDRFRHGTRSYALRSLDSSFFITTLATGITIGKEDARSSGVILL